MQKSDIKILLVQLRVDEAMQAQEVRALCRSGDIRPEQITIINGLEQTISKNDLVAHHMLIIGGTGDYSVFDQLPVIESLTEVVQHAKDTNFPVLGSCWGAQFIAKIFGGTVETDPKKEEVGSYLVWPTQYADDDPLFYDAPQGFWAQIGHHQSITKLPEGAVNLISSERCEIQAFTWLGSRMYGLQLHSDLSKDELVERVVHYREGYASDPALFNAIIDNAKDSPYTDDLVAKFIDRIVLPSAAA